MSLALINLQRVLQEIRNVNPDMPTSTALAFVYIAQRNQTAAPTTIQDVGAYLGVSSASASRNVMALTKVSWTRKEGAGLVYSEENPERRIEKFLYLTEDGKALVKRLEDYLCR